MPEIESRFLPAALLNEDVGRLAAADRTCCVLQDWQERYIHHNYSRIIKDQLIETVSSNSRRVTQAVELSASHSRCPGVCVCVCLPVCKSVPLNLHLLVLIY